MPYNLGANPFFLCSYPRNSYSTALNHSLTVELLNIQFAILLVKLAICVLPFVVGVALILSKEEEKREMRNRVCIRLFDVDNAINYRKFARAIIIVGLAFVAFSAAATWFLFLADMSFQGASYLG